MVSMIIYNIVEIYVFFYSEGINIYGLYKRSNTDGSESESITQLTDNLVMNKGNEISLEPNKPMDIKVY